MKHFQNLCIPTKPLPVFQLHGTEDVISRYEGDMANNDGYGAYLSVPKTVSFWAKTNGLDEKAELLLEDIDKNDNTTVLFQRIFQPTTPTKSGLIPCAVAGIAGRWRIGV